MSTILNPSAENEDEFEGWKERTPMKKPRSSFASTVIGNKVFVWGGFSGKSDKEGGSHFPLMAFDIEEYNAFKDSWTVHALKTPMSLAAFGYAPISQNFDKIIIVGGTNGEELSDAVYTLDFTAKELTKVDCSLPYPIAESKVAFSAAT